MKKGDKVTLKDGLKAWKVYGGLFFHKSMRFDGVVELPEPTKMGNYKINNWYYSPEMLEQVKTDTL